MEFFGVKSLLFISAVNILVFLASCEQYNTDDAFLQCLVQFRISSNSSFDHVYTQSDVSYSSVYESLVLNLRFVSTSTVKPRLILTPTQDSEIVEAVQCSKKLGVQLRVRSGGHDFEGLSYASEIPFVMVDMRNYRSISISTEDNTAWIQTGAILGELYYELAQTSKTLAFPAGVCPTVGVGGHFGGGGYGMISRKHGLSIDNIVDAKIVDANGQILDRKSMGEDLFWAIRGGGGTSFGIVLAYKVNLIVVPEIVTVFNVSRTLEQKAIELVHKWQYIADNIDDDLAIRVFISSSRSPTTGNRTVRVSFPSLYLGGVDDLLTIMQDKFPEMGLTKSDCLEMSWFESALFFPDLRNQPPEVLLNRTYGEWVYSKAKSDYVRQPIPEQGLQGLWKFMEEATDFAELQFSPYGGIFNRVLESETPFPHRAGNIFSIEYGAVWSSEGNSGTERNLNWIRSLYSYMAPYVSNSPRAAYSNYRDLDIGMNNKAGTTSYREASVWGFKYYKNNFKRLVRVKTKVDTSNLFRNEQSIPPMLSVPVIEHDQVVSS